MKKKLTLKAVYSFIAIIITNIIATIGTLLLNLEQPLRVVLSITKVFVISMLSFYSAFWILYLITIFLLKIL